MKSNSVNINNPKIIATAIKTVELTTLNCFALVLFCHRTSCLGRLSSDHGSSSGLPTVVHHLVHLVHDLHSNYASHNPRLLGKAIKMLIS